MLRFERGKYAAGRGRMQQRQFASDQLNRRTFIGLLGGAAAWPLTAGAQQTGRMRRIGVLMPFENDAEAQALMQAFRQELDKLGWNDGGNIRIDERWSAERDRIWAD